MPCVPGCPLNTVVELIAAAVVAHLQQCQRQETERLISPNEAARRLNLSRRSLDRQRNAMPFVVMRHSGRGYDVSESRLSEYIARKA